MPAPSVVRNTGYVSGTSVSSLTASFAALPSVGNGIVAIAGTFTNNGAETWTFSDNQTNTYSTDVSGESGTGGTSGNHAGVALGHCGAVTTSAGTFSVKMQLSVAHTSGFIAFEANGALTLDKTTLTQVVGATGPQNVTTSTASTTTQANEICVAAFSADDSTVSAAAGEWTANAGSTAVSASASPAPTTSFSFFAAYGTTTSSGVTASVGATCANTGNCEPVACIATYYTAGGGTTTNIAPSKGAIVLAGHAPGILETVGPSVGHVVLAGHAPGILELIGPTTGRITLAGYVPGITETLLPSAGHLTLAGHAPGITGTLLPSVGHLLLAAHTPGLSFSVGPSTGHIVLTGYAPTPTPTSTPVDWLQRARHRRRRR